MNMKTELIILPFVAVLAVLQGVGNTSASGEKVEERVPEVYQTVMSCAPVFAHGHAEALLEKHLQVGLDSISAALAYDSDRQMGFP